MIAPMLCHNATLEQIREGAYPADRWTMERKWDGWRFVFEREEDGVHSYAGRNSSNYTGQLPEIEAALEQILPVGTMIDTEVVAVGEGLHSSDVTSVIAHPMSGKLIVVAFDVLKVAGLDATTYSLSARRQALNWLFAGNTSPLLHRTVWMEPDAEAYRKLVQEGAEGVVLKRLGSTYQVGKRSHDWLKLKHTATIDGTVVGFKEGKAGWAGTVGAFEVTLENGAHTTVAVADDEQRLAVTARREPFFGRRMEIKHWGLGKEGVPRHPTFLRWREDLEEAAA